MNPPQALQAALDSYRVRCRQEVRDVARIRELMAHADPWSRGTPLHVTASALVVHPPSARVLLRWHARMRCWAQVGGHADAGEIDPWRIALREASEESGLSDLGAWPAGAGQAPIQIVIVDVGAHGAEAAHEHADIRYLFSTSTPELAAAETAETPVRWLAINDALACVTEDNLREFLRRTGRLLEAFAPG